MTATGETSNTLVVLGATGNQGGAVLKYFASQPAQLGFRLRGVTRNPDSAPSQELKALGIEMVQADLGDPVALQKAFSGATHVFANTDSNQLIFDALKHPEKLNKGQSPVEYAADVEKRFGQNIADAAAAATPTLQRIVWSSLPSPKRLSGGRYSKVAMFDAKEEIANVLKAKPELRNILSILLVGFYAGYVIKKPDLYGPKKQQDGVYEFAFPMPGDIPVPIADLDADAGQWVFALFQASPGVTLVGGSEYMTWKTWLSLWGDHNKVQTRYRHATAENFSKEMAPFMDSIVEEGKFVEEYGFSGGDKNVTAPEELRKAGVTVQTTKIGDFIARSDWSHML